MKMCTLAAIATVWISFFSPAYAQWIGNNGSSGFVHSFAVSPDSLGSLFAGTVGGTIFRSTNNGTSWAAVFAGTYVDALATSGTNIFAGTDGGVFRSTNNGTTWTAAGLTNNLYPQALAISGSNLFAGTYQSGVFLSTNNGTSWTAINNGLTGASLNIVALIVSDTNLFAGTWGGGVMRSTNNGTSWTAANNGITDHVHSFAVSPNGAGGTNLFAGTYFANGVYLSTNNGTSWTSASIGLTNSNVRALAVSPNGAGGTNLFAGTDGGGVFLSTNNGISWTVVNTGLTNFVVNALLVSGTNLFAGTNDGIWRRSLSEITSVREISSSEIPGSFELKQNYPNPFNPSTVIKFEVPSSKFVTLKVFDVLGREVRSLVNEELKAGGYEKTFDANGLASGVYYYRIQAGNFVETKKLMVLR